MVSKIFKNLFNKTISEENRRMHEALSSVPGPSPWYLYKMGPKIQTKYGVTQWLSAGDEPKTSGKFILKGGDNNLAVFNFYNYIRPLKDPLLLIWNQSYSEKSPTFPVNLFIFDCDSLQPFSNLDEIYEQMTKEKTSIYHLGGLKDKVEIVTTQIEGKFELDFPDVLKETVDELLILAHSSGIGEWGYKGNNLCIISVRPKTGTYEFYPQDWFNNGSYDFGYQWVTHVARDPKTQKICGDGIRIRSFVLDKTNRKIERYL